MASQKEYMVPGAYVVSNPANSAVIATHLLDAGPQVALEAGHGDASHWPFCRVLRAVRRTRRGAQLVELTTSALVAGASR